MPLGTTLQGNVVFLSPSIHWPYSPLLQNTPDPEQDRGWMDSQNSGKGKLPLGKRGTNKGQVRGEPKSQTGHAGRGRIGCRAIPGRSKGEVMDRAHQVEDNPLVEGKGTGQDRDIHRSIEPRGRGQPTPNPKAQSQ